jgi:thiamine-phosphate diphosphorylase
MMPVICMVTARAPSTPQSDRALVERIGAAARAGVHLVQIREPDFGGCDLRRLVDAAVLAVKGTRARVLVNDRLDVALAAGAHGVHLRSDSVAAPRIRAVAPSAFLIGRSVHSPEEAERVARDGGLDYLIFGTVFSTSSKPGVDATGAGPLAAACAAVPLPVLAIGGMVPERLGTVAESGAAGLAAISLFAEGPPDAFETAVRRIEHAFEAGSKPSEAPPQTTKHVAPPR